LQDFWCQTRSQFVIPSFLRFFSIHSSVDGLQFAHLRTYFEFVATNGNGDGQLVNESSQWIYEWEMILAVRSNTLILRPETF
jgi:hypothetical protein